MEMFQRPFQPVIDRYLAGEIAEAELMAQTEYEARWGFPWEFYAPVLRFARANQIPVLALNTPREITWQVSGQGLASLEEEDFRYIPPLDAIDLSNDNYREFVATALGDHNGHGSFNFENFFAAQVLWDETIAEFKLSHSDTQMVVLARSGHIIYGYGIPDRVGRRLGAEVEQITVLLNLPEESLAEAGNDIADIIWYSADL